MKKIVLCSILSMSIAAPLMADDTNVLTDDKARLSYSIGVTFANRWKEQGVDVDPDVVLRGLKDTQAGRPPLMSPQEMSSIMNKVQQDIADRTQQRLAQIKAEGEAFLAANKTKPGVVTLPDGMQYKIITEGGGAMPVNGDTVTINFRGTFVDGTQFAIRNSAQVPVGRNAIPGLDEALKLMKVGSKWQIVHAVATCLWPEGHRPHPARLDANHGCGTAFNPASQSPPAPPPAARQSAAHQRHHCRAFRRGIEERQAALYHQGGGHPENPAKVAAHKLMVFV